MTRHAASIRCWPRTSSTWNPSSCCKRSRFCAAATASVQELKGPAVGAAWEKIKRWFWCSNLGQRYEGPPNTLNATDLRQLTAWVKNDAEIPEAVSTFTLDDLDLGGIKLQRNAIYRSVICLTIVNGA